MTFASFSPLFSQDIIDTSEVTISKSMAKEDRELLKNAQFFFREQVYLKALPRYALLAEIYPTHLSFKFKTGVCYLFKTDEKQKAIEFLEYVYKKNPKMEDVMFYLGRAYHLNYKFDKAIEIFQKFLAEKPPYEKKELVNRYIENCESGIKLLSNPVRCRIRNIGSVINTKEAEYVPLVSMDDSVLIFTYKGERSTGGLMDDENKPDPEGDYYEDVFISRKKGRNWQYPIGIQELNTKQDDASVSLSPAGNTIFLYKSTNKDQGDIYISKLKGDKWSVPVNLGEPINTKFYEGSACLSADENTLYFSSERPGGQGGKDIWKSQKLSNGRWSAAVNLGPDINTKYNEDSPFIHPMEPCFFSVQTDTTAWEIMTFFTPSWKVINGWMLKIWGTL